MSTSSKILKRLSFKEGIAIVDKTICKFFNLISINEIKVKSKKSEFVKPRQFAHYFGMQCYGAATVKIGMMYGNKDHATVLHSCKVINQQLSEVNGKIVDIELYRLVEDMVEFIDHEVKKRYELLRIHRLSIDLIKKEPSSLTLQEQILLLKSNFKIAVYVPAT